MPTDKIRKYILPNIPYLFIGWACLKLGTAYRLATGAGFGEKLLGLGRSIGPAFADFAPGLDPFDWLVGIVGAVAFRLLIYFKSKNAKRNTAPPGGAPKKTSSLLSILSLKIISFSPGQSCSPSTPGPKIRPTPAT